MSMAKLKKVVDSGNTNSLVWKGSDCLILPQLVIRHCFKKLNSYRGLRLKKIFITASKRKKSNIVKFGTTAGSYRYIYFSLDIKRKNQTFVKVFKKKKIVCAEVVLHKFLVFFIIILLFWGDMVPLKNVCIHFPGKKSIWKKKETLWEKKWQNVYSDKYMEKMIFINLSVQNFQVRCKGWPTRRWLNE